MLLPNCSQEQYYRAIEKLRKRIDDIGGTLKREPFFLSDNTPIIRAALTPYQLSSIENDNAIFRVEETNYYHFEQSNAVTEQLLDRRLDTDVDKQTLDPVVVIDSGVDFSKTPLLNDFVLEHWTASDVIVSDTSHGTQVASRVILGDTLEQQMRTGRLTPLATVIDACIKGDDILTEDQIIVRVREVVEEFHEKSKIYNLSMNADKPIHGDRISLLAFEIDILCRKYGVVFTISSGNHNVWSSRDSIEKIVDDDDALIASPAESYLGLTVGSINDEDDPDSLSKKDELSPFSRIGPGFACNEKPDIVAFGGNISKINGLTFGTKVITNKGECQNISGTSFASPVVAGNLASIISNIPPENAPLLAKTLLLHTARPLYDYAQLSDEQIAYYKKMYGIGCVSLERSLSSTSNRVTFIAQGELNRQTKHRVKFYVPQILSDHSNRNHPAKITVTSLVLPPLDHSKGREYLGAYASASLHKRIANGNMPSVNPKSTTSGRQKWQSIYHFKKEFCNFVSGDWEVWLELFTRWDTDRTENIPYVLAITLEAASNDTQLYEKLMEEVPNRYHPLTRTTVTQTIRQRVTGGDL